MAIDETAPPWHRREAEETAVAPAPGKMLPQEKQRGRPEIISISQERRVVTAASAAAYCKRNRLISALLT